jgi:hypothetical protein
MRNGGFVKHFPAMVLRSIPHKNHRYVTCGDYFKEGKYWQVVTSKTNADMEFLVLIHEMIELYLTQKRGIAEPKIKAFDEMFEKERDSGKWKDEEPGDDRRAPYYNEHQFSTKIEKLCCDELKIDWDKYEETMLRLFK